MTRVAVALLDSGINPVPGIRIAAARGFGLGKTDGDVVRCAATPDESGHGTALARIIAGLAPGAELYSARVFTGADPSSAALVAAGLDWAVAAGARLVNMSFGLRADRVVLRRACARALEQGVVLVAAAPAQGGPVFPAAYTGMVRVTGDARCAPREYAWIGDERVDFGACVGGLDHIPHAPGGGASFAVAHVVAGLAVRLPLYDHPHRALDDLRRACRFVGRERRDGASRTGM